MYYHTIEIIFSIYISCLNHNKLYSIEIFIYVKAVIYIHETSLNYRKRVTYR